MLLHLPTNISNEYEEILVWKSDGDTHNGNGNLVTSKNKDFIVITSKVGTYLNILSIVTNIFHFSDMT